MRRGIMWVLKCIVFGVAMVALVGFVTTSLWNWLVPVLFAGPVITFWQAIGLLILSKIFFWSFGGHRHGGYRQGAPWKHYWKQKMSSMSPEEREELKRKMKERWCRWDDSASRGKSESSNG
jgi:hypothetical protein